MRVRQPIIHESEYPEDIRFIVYGHSVPKARARTVGGQPVEQADGTFKKGKSHTFTPKTTVEWEASIYGQSLASKPPYPWRGGVALGVLFFKRIPKTKRKKFERSGGLMRPVGARDDYDNLIKTVKDALNGIYWLDDGQVVEYIPVEIEGKELHPGKYFSDLPRIEILVKFLDDVM